MVLCIMLVSSLIIYLNPFSIITDSQEDYLIIIIIVSKSINKIINNDSTTTSYDKGVFEVEEIWNIFRMSLYTQVMSSKKTVE